MSELKRTVEQWSKCDPKEMARMSEPAIMYALADAKSDVLRMHAALETLTLYKNLADEYGLSIFKDLKDLTTEIENLREKLKTYEDLGGAADDVQLLRMGYAAARLELESLKARPAGAPQPSPVAQGDAMDSWRLDWLALAGPVHICLVIDREHDGDVEVSLDGATGYGKTLRAAIDAARAAQEVKSND